MSSTHLKCTGRRTGRILAVVICAGSLSVLAGCANNSASGSTYTYGQAQHEQIVRTGTVVSVRNVTIQRSEEHTSELQSLMRISYAVFCLKKKKNKTLTITQNTKQIRT